jgi:hypothetical protein
MQEPAALGSLAKSRVGHDLHAPVTRADHRRGAPRPTIIIVEYGDFASRACRAAEPAVKMLLAAYPDGKVCDVSGGMHELGDTVAAAGRAL